MALLMVIWSFNKLVAWRGAVVYWYYPKFELMADDMSWSCHIFDVLINRQWQAGNIAFGS